MSLPNASATPADILSSANFPASGSRKAAAAVLIGSSLLALGAMMLHPFPHAHSMQEFVTEVGGFHLRNAGVHGCMIALVVLQLFGLSIFSSYAGSSNGAIRLAIISYGLGTLMMVAAATVNGFILPAYLARLSEATPEELAIGRQVLYMLAEVNHTCDLFGTVAMSAAVLCWGIGLLLRPHARGLAAIGVVVGLVGVVGVFAGFLTATVHGVLAFVAMQTVWNLAAAASLLRNSLGFPPSQ